MTDHIEMIATGRTWPDRVLGLSVIVASLMLGVRLVA